MIQANELRIGNWIDDVKPQNMALPQHYYFQVKWEHIAKAEAKWEYRPIPLTPEILEKAGFEHDWNEGSKQRWSNEHIEIWGDFKEGFLLLNGEERTHWSNEIKYVHQLQNLYFALTGEELKIEL